MRLTMDATAVRPFDTGVGTYSLNIIEQVLQVAKEQRLAIDLDIIIQPDLDPNHTLFAIAAAYPNVRIRQFPIPAIGPKRDLLYLRHLMQLKQRDLFHCLSSNLPLAIRRRAVVTIHNLSFLKHPRLFGSSGHLKLAYIDTLFRHAARSAAHIIAVSDSIRRDFSERYRSSIDKKQTPISVVHEAAGTVFSTRLREGAPNSFPIARPQSVYFLAVGELRPHKNIPRLIEAFARFRTRVAGDNVRLRIYGGWHPSFSLPDALPAGVEINGPVANDQLVPLYTNAIGFCCVSYFESFGIPILEAMCCGVPTIVSNTTAMPEVAGDAALQVDPNDTEAIAQALWRLYSDADLRLHLRHKGLERARHFSWRRAAHETVRIYRAAVAH